MRNRGGAAWLVVVMLLGCLMSAPAQPKPPGPGDHSLAAHVDGWGRLVGKMTNKINADDVIWEFFQNHPKP
ncbi:MAG TPA: hypothetical protein VLY20_06600 [Nitrospiria bacterium]|nr:hypothetical protein [Nitrospiria bacterium]